MSDHDPPSTHRRPRRRASSSALSRTPTPPPRPFAMLAPRTIARPAKTTTATVASKKTASRGQTIVRKNSKGGEEGARAVGVRARETRETRRASRSTDDG